jgi:hypothetical protein
VIHWWNHGLGQKQTLTVTLHSADGTPRSSSTSVFLWPGNSGGNTGFTSYITVHPVEASDYLVIRNNGTNVGWRATAVYYLEESGYSLYPLEPTIQGYHYDDIFGFLFVHDASLGYSVFMGNLYVAAYPWIYQFPTGWLFHAGGAFPSGLYLYSQAMGWLYVNGNYGGFYYQYDPGQWRNFL